MLRGLDDLPACDDSALYQQACDWSSRAAFVSVAVLDATTSGAALDLALGCDLRVCSTSAVLSAPGPSAAGALVAAVGYATALDLAVTGRTLSGAQAHSLGLVQRLAPPEQLEAEVERLVADMVAPDRDLVRELKALLLGAREQGTQAQRDAQAEALERLKSSGPDGAPRD